LVYSVGRMAGVTVDVYLVRHGRSESNDAGDIILGRCEGSPLVPIGVEQARRLGATLGQAGVRPAAVFSSPTARAKSTALLAVEAAGLTCEVVEDAGLHEQDVGSWFGQVASRTFDQVCLAEIGRLGKDFRPPGGESMNDVGARMLAWLDRLDSSSAVVAGPVFAFTHGGAIRSLVSLIQEWSHARTYETKPENCSVTLISRQPPRRQAAPAARHTGKRWSCEFLALAPNEAFSSRDLVNLGPR